MGTSVAPPETGASLGWMPEPSSVGTGEGERETTGAEDSGAGLEAGGWLTPQEVSRPRVSTPARAREEIR